ncbi:MAG TPA: hydrogenase [Candidatus Eisenbacteria bacterium]|nr:hydrogenase [Candidatus Eisenbacteria bacterium]
MTTAVDAILVGVILTSFVLLGSSRFGSCIRVVALQGVLLGVLTLAARQDEASLRTTLLALASTGLKGIAFPWLLARALRDAEVRREVEPLVGYGPSVLMGLMGLVGALWLASRLRPPGASVLPSLVVPVALFTMFAGLFLIVGRRQALMQVLGYLVMENGIYVFGVGVVQGTPVLVELGVLLDVFVGVFVMGIAMFHISREFDHIDTERLRALKDWTP